MSVILDAGALVAIDRGDRTTTALLRVAQTRGTPVRTSGGVVAQVWRHGSRQAVLARTLQGIDVVAIDATSGKRVGELLRSSGFADVIDAHVALLVGPDDTIVTSDPEDIKHLLDARQLRAKILTA